MDRFFLILIRYINGFSCVWSAIELLQLIQPIYLILHAMNYSLLIYSLNGCSYAWLAKNVFYNLYFIRFHVRHFTYLFGTFQFAFNDQEKMIQERTFKTGGDSKFITKIHKNFSDNWDSNKLWVPPWASSYLI